MNVESCEESNNDNGKEEDNINPNEKLLNADDEHQEGGVPIQ
uniref:Uncharacterized protein n=1 Tax=Plectus sambesii TaxID=2011161 RepID=A0A914VH17_9BILA